MHSFRVSYNLHRYRDCSDMPTKGTRIIEAADEDQAWVKMARMRENGNDASHGPGRKRFIGTIDSLIEEE